MKYIYLILLLLPLQAFSQMSFMFDDTNAWDTLDTPLGTDSLVLWFAADRAVVDSAGNSISNGEGVGIWYDLSGNGNNAIQTDTTKDPRWCSSCGPSSMPALIFDGVNDILEASGISMYSNDFSFFIVYKFDNPTANVVDNVISFSSWGLRGRDNTVSYRVEVSIEDVTPTAQVYYYDGARSGSYILTSFVKQLTNSSSWWNNGVSQTVTNQIVNGGDGDIRPTGGGVFRMGGLGTIRMFDGAICEVILTHSAISTAKRQSIENYLINKYGL